MATSSSTSTTVKTTDENLRSIKKRLLDELTAAIETQFLVRVTSRKGSVLAIQPWRDDILEITAEVSRWDDDRDVIDLDLEIAEKHHPRYEEDFTPRESVNGWVSWPRKMAGGIACDEWGLPVDSEMTKAITQACEQVKGWLTDKKCEHLIR